jgi:hypothetical protein
MSKKPPKPPLPAGIEPSPRKKEKRMTRDDRDSIQAALTALIDAEPTKQHYAQYIEEANAEKNDRGAAILIATNLENVLESAIIRQLQLGSKRRDLFGLNSPAGTFDFKVRIGHALRIFGDETRGNLDIIRSIRNTFAHAKIPIKFTEPAITKACALLIIPRLLPPVSRPIGWRPE